MNDNLNIWDKLCKPPTDALKQISGGRLRGKTEINPQWRLEVMTEVFGPIGHGWKYTIDKLWIESGPHDQILAFAMVNVYWRCKDSWSEPIPGIGGSMMVERETGGLHASDEAYKMAVTDALSVALKALGVGSEIYRGHFNGSKYSTSEIPNVQNKTHEVKPAYPEDRFKDSISSWGLAIKNGKTPEGIIKTISTKYTLSQDQKTKIKALAKPKPGKEDSEK